MVARIHRDFSIPAHSHSALRVSQNKICFGLKFTSAREGRRSYWLIMTADDSVKSQFAHSTMKGQVKGLSASFSFLPLPSPYSPPPDSLLPAPSSRNPRRLLPTELSSQLGGNWPLCEMINHYNPSISLCKSILDCFEAAAS